MIGQIGPLVEAGTLSKSRLAMHIAGGAFGGLLSGAILGLVAASLGSLLGATRLLDASLIMSPVVLIVLGASDLELWDGRLLTGSRQTPGYWSCSFGPAWGLFAWGLDLGNGMTTRIPHQVLLGVVALSMLSGHFLVAVIVMSIYGTARTSSVAWAILRAGTTDVGVVCSTINRREPTINNLVGAASLALGLAIAVAAV